MTLHDEIIAWKTWAKTADQSQDGWESFYPNWRALMSIACDTMSQANLSSNELELVSFCWSISEETEDLADVVRAAPNQYLCVITELATDSNAQARWQALDVCDRIGAVGEAILEGSLADADPYCRRRAALALLRVRPNDADIIRQLCRDDDVCNRNVGEQLGEHLPGATP